MEPPFEIGSVIDGKYRVERTIGSGGMGVVFLARHLQLRERVAIKVLKPDRTGRPGLVERLLREARAAASIRSPHVVRVLDVGALPDAQPYIVMEFLEGEDLATLIGRTGPQPLSEAVDYVLQACEALAEAHARGVVHRDLKPANLFLERRASGAVSVKVLDFGVARFLSGHTTEPSADSSLTGSNAFVGSPAYMSPEQLTRPEEVGTRADIWALGVILYELLSGSQPFKGATLALTCTKILQEPPLKLERADLPADVRRALGRALEKEPERRFASVLELANALAPHGSSIARASLTEIEAVARREPFTTEQVTSIKMSEHGSPTLTGSVLRAHSTAATFRIRIGLATLGVAAVVVALLFVATRPRLKTSNPGEDGLASAATTTVTAAPPLPAAAPAAAPSAAAAVSPAPTRPSTATKGPAERARMPESPAAASPSVEAPAASAAPPGDASERLYEFRK